MFGVFVSRIKCKSLIISLFLTWYWTVIHLYVTICMKLDPGMHIGLHLVFFGKTGVTAWAHPGPVRGLLRPVLLLASSRSSPLLHVGPCLSELDEAPCFARFSTFLARSSEFFIFSGLVLGLLESCSLHCLTCTGLQGLVMRCLMNLSQKSCFQR
jgi:hypothetical protein